MLTAFAILGWLAAVLLLAVNVNAGRHDGRIIDGLKIRVRHLEEDRGTWCAEANRRQTQCSEISAERDQYHDTLTRIFATSREGLEKHVVRSVGADCDRKEESVNAHRH